MAETVKILGFAGSLRKGSYNKSLLRAADKPVAIMGASVGTLGTARAQYHLRQSCVFVDMHPLNQPEVMVASAQDKIDPAGHVTDEKTRQKIKDLLAALVAWTHRLK